MSDLSLNHPKLTTCHWNSALMTSIKSFFCLAFVLHRSNARSSSADLAASNLQNEPGVNEPTNPRNSHRSLDILAPCSTENPLGIDILFRLSRSPTGATAFFPTAIPRSLRFLERLHLS
jgi:hypothetical protein